MDKVKTLAEWIQQSQNIVFFGGAGTSTESGIPDFRSAAGLYQSEEKLPYPPEVMLSRSFFVKHPEVFFGFYRSKMLHPDAEPNGCHRFLAALEQQGRLKAVVTQNIDSLHQAAGSVNVLELHGSVHRNHCMECGRFYSLNEVIDSTEVVPKCPVDGGIIKPDVVLYEEELDQDTLVRSIQAISQADLLLIGGTSLTVHPAAGLITYFHGKHTVLLNTDPTSYDHKADLLITNPIGRVMGELGSQLSL